MKEELKALLEQYETAQKKYEIKLTATRQAIKEGEDELKTLYGEGFKSYRENKDAIKEVNDRIQKARATAEEYILAIKICKECKVDSAAHALIDDIRANAEKWQKYPTHYKKFDELVNNIVGDGFYLKNSCGLGSYYLETTETGNNNNYFILYTTSGQIDEKTLADMESKLESYCEVAPSDTLKEAKRIIKTRAAILDKINKAKADIDELRKGFKGASAYNYLPYISKVENDGTIYTRYTN